MVFKTITDDVTGAITQISIFNSTLSTMKRNLASGQGITYSIFNGNKLTQKDVQAIISYSNALKNGASVGQAWSTNMTNCSVAAKQYVVDAKKAGKSTDEMVSGLSKIPKVTNLASVGLKGLATGGDDIINSRIAAANLNGTNYIWKFSPFQLEDMSEDLVNAIVEYQALVSSDEVKDEYYGENGIYTRLIDLYKQQSYIEHSKMPESTIVQVGTAEEQWNKLKNAIQGSYVYVNNLSTYNANAHVGVDNMVEEYLNILIDSRYELEIIKDNDAKVVI